MSEDNDETAKEPENTAPDAQGQGNYLVGYKKPPKHSQFKKGEPSPRKGKKVKAYYYNDRFWQIAREKVEVNTGGKIKKMTLFEAWIRKLGQLAINGDRRALIYLLETFANDSAIRRRTPGELGRIEFEIWQETLEEEDE